MHKNLFYTFLFIVSLTSCVKNEYQDDKIDPTYVYGIVKDYKTGEPIEDVILKISVGDPGSPLGYWVYDSVITNSKGYYEMQFDSYSTYLLTENEKSSLPLITVMKNGYYDDGHYVYPEDIQKIDFKLIKR